jgi:phosphoglycerate dehydrogenase-like enzyme
MNPWTLPAPECWKVVSTSALRENDVRRFLPAETAAVIVVVEPRTEDAAAEAVVDADIVIGDYLFEVPINARVIDGMKRCRLIQQPSVGYQQIDVTAAAARGIPVANAAGANDASVAEHTVMVGLALLRGLTWADAEVRSGGWPQLTRGHRDLAGKTWGIVGLGRIGRQVVRRISGWDVPIVYYDPVRAEPEEEARLDISYVELNELLEVSDVVSLHVPLLPSTHHLLDAERLALLKTSACLINVARGEIVDEHALMATLDDKRIAGAALDVFEYEPLLAEHPLTRLDNVILTPHFAGTTVEARARVMKLTAANIQRVVRGHAPIDIVNLTRLQTR